MINLLHQMAYMRWKGKELGIFLFVYKYVFNDAVTSSNRW